MPGDVPRGSHGRAVMRRATACRTSGGRAEGGWTGVSRVCEFGVARPGGDRAGG